MKDIMLKIVGTQNVDNDTDTIEFMTEGRIYQKGDATYIVYEESKFSGLEGCKTTVKVSGDKVKMFRFSDGFPVDTQIEFERANALRAIIRHLLVLLKWRLQPTASQTTFPLKKAADSI